MSSKEDRNSNIVLTRTQVCFALTEARVFLHAFPRIGDRIDAILIGGLIAARAGDPDVIAIVAKLKDVALAETVGHAEETPLGRLEGKHLGGVVVFLAVAEGIEAIVDLQVDLLQAPMGFTVVAMTTAIGF